MGKKLSIMPKYIRDFNIENRAAREIDLNKIRQSPRHPSTIEIFKKKEDAASQVDEQQQNRKIVESNIKVFGGVKIKSESDLADKRPKKENEMKFIYEKKFDIDYDKYGYTKPDKIKPGQFTLRQFDEMINEYKQAKKVGKSSDSIGLIEESLSKKYEIDKATFNILIQYYKPLNIVMSAEKTEKMPPIEEIFPNVNKLEINNINTEKK